MIYAINGRINSQTVENIVRLYNNYNPESKEKILIYINSNGGNYDDGMIILDLINIFYKSTVLYAIGRICSTAFEIFYKARCEKEIKEGTVGMFHLSTIDISIDERGKPSHPEDEARLTHIQNEIKRSEIFCKSIGMSKSELNQIIKKNQDIYFYEERLKYFKAKSDAFYCTAV